MVNNKTEQILKRQSLKGTKSAETGYVQTDFNVMSASLAFDAVFVSCGQQPNVERVGLHKAGIQYHRQRGIVVNDFLQTTNPDVYAAGDCCTRYQYTHMADDMAKIVVRNALFFGRNRLSELLVPRC